VRPQLCGICGSDLHEYESGGMFIHKEDMPQILGHEFSADVLEVGPMSPPCASAIAARCSRTCSAVTAISACAVARRSVAPCASRA